MRELNWKLEQSADLTVLGGPGNDGINGQVARIIELSGKRMRVAAQLPVTSGAPVRLEWDGQLLLGQVLTAEPGGFWMEIHHMLLDTPELNWQKQGWQRS